MKYKLGFLFLIMFLSFATTLMALSFIDANQKKIKFNLDSTPIPIIYYELGAAEPYTFSILDAAKQYKLEPEYLAAMIINESCVTYDATGTNCLYVNPWSYGLVQEEGLCQINPNQFRASASAYWEPDFNIHEGARLLREALDVGKGNLYVGMSLYNTGIYATWINHKYSLKAMGYYNVLKSQRKLIYFKF